MARLIDVASQTAEHFEFCEGRVESHPVNSERQCDYDGSFMDAYEFKCSHAVLRVYHCHICGQMRKYGGRRRT